jgi:hypothetical protein
MSYQKRKEIIAILSISSVVITLTATIVMKGINLDIGKSFTFVTAVSAFIAAIAAGWTIILTRRLEKERERRRIFIIYAREDLDTARRLTAELRERGYNSWLDVDEITPGQFWQRAVLNALEESAAALVLVSGNLKKKGFVQQELKAAFETLPEREKDVSPMVPVRLDDSPIPEYLSHIQWVNLFDKNGLESLLTSLNKIVKTIPEKAAAN